jgi:hypothetical protein
MLLGCGLSLQVINCDQWRSVFENIHTVVFRLSQRILNQHSCYRLLKMDSVLQLWLLICRKHQDKDRWYVCGYVSTRY